MKQAIQPRNTILSGENLKLRFDLAVQRQMQNLVGGTLGMRQALEQIAQLGPGDSHILILGENGVGKQLVAEALHAASRQGHRALIHHACAAFPKEQSQRELFGHEAGRKGRFQQAQGGSLYLDEINTLPAETQSELALALRGQDLPGRDGTPRVRLFASASSDLATLVADGKFNEGLYCQICAHPIFLPPLRSRKADIPALVNHFIEQFCEEHQKKIVRVSTPAIDMLMQYSWPGNLHELANCIERAVLLAEDGVIRGYHFPFAMQAPGGKGGQPDLRHTLKTLEIEFITEAFKAERGNAAAAARRLGVTERILGLRLKRYGIETQEFRQFSSF